MSFEFDVSIPGTSKSYNKTSFTIDISLYKDHILFHQWTISHRYHEFYSLYQQFVSLNLNYDEIPPKHTFHSQTPSFINQRRLALQRWINNILYAFYQEHNPSETSIRVQIHKYLSSFLGYEQYLIHPDFVNILNTDIKCTPTVHLSDSTPLSVPPLQGLSASPTIYPLTYTFETPSVHSAVSSTQNLKFKDSPLKEISDPNFIQNTSSNFGQSRFPHLTFSSQNIKSLNISEETNPLPTTESSSSSLNECYSPVSVPGSPLMREVHEAQLGQYTNSVLSIVCSQLSRSPLSSVDVHDPILSPKSSRAVQADVVNSIIPLPSSPLIPQHVNTQTTSEENDYFKANTSGSSESMNSYKQPYPEVYNPFSWENQSSYKQNLVNFINNKVDATNTVSPSTTTISEYTSPLANSNHLRTSNNNIQIPSKMTSSPAQNISAINTLNNQQDPNQQDITETVRLSLYILKREYDQCVDLLGSAWRLYDNYDDCFCLIRKSGIDGYIGRTVISAPAQQLFKTLVNPYIYSLIDTEYSTNLKIIQQYSDVSYLFYLELFMDYDSTYDSYGDNLPMNPYASTSEGIYNLPPLLESSYASPLPNENDSTGTFDNESSYYYDDVLSDEESYEEEEADYEHVFNNEILMTKPLPLMTNIYHSPQPPMSHHTLDKDINTQSSYLETKQEQNIHTTTSKGSYIYNPNTIHQTDSSNTSNDSINDIGLNLSSENTPVYNSTLLHLNSNKDIQSDTFIHQKNIQNISLIPFPNNKLNTSIQINNPTVYTNNNNKILQNEHMTQNLNEECKNINNKTSTDILSHDESKEIPSNENIKTSDLKEMSSFSSNQSEQLKSNIFIKSIGIEDNDGSFIILYQSEDLSTYINTTKDDTINRNIPTTIFYPSGFVITPFGHEMSKVTVIYQIYNNNSEFIRNKWRETAKQRSLFVHRLRNYFEN